MQLEKKKLSRKYLYASVIVVIVIIASIGVYYYWITTQKPAGVETIKIGILVGLSGVMADVGKTQRDGAILAIMEVNEAGGLKMPWGRVKVDYVVRDDETNVDVATRRYWELVDVEGVKAVVGTCWGPIAVSLNEQSKKSKVPYAIGAAWLTNVQKSDTRSKYMIGAMPSAYMIGYTAAAYSINQGWKKIYFLGRSDIWGWDMRDGVNKAINDLGGELVGYDEAPIGAPDFTPYLLKVQAAKPDVFIFAQFAADQVNVLKQAYAMGLKEKMVIFPAWITNAVAVGVPPEALADTYALHYFYWNFTGAPGLKEFAEKYATPFVKKYMETWGYPPDSYATATYIATRELLRAMEVAGSTDGDAIINALESLSPTFTTCKGPGRWRIAHDVVWDYAFFVVKGKGHRSWQYDLYEIIGYYGGEQIMQSLSDLGY